MKTLKDILAIIILLVIGFLLSLIVFDSFRDYTIGTTETIDTVYVTKTEIIRDTVYFPEIKWKEKIKFKPVPQDVDTTEILKLFFESRYIERNIERTHLSLTIKDTISQNRIQWSQIEYQLSVDTVFREVTITRDIERYRKGFYGNLMISTKYISPGVSYMNRNGYQFGIGLHIGKEPAPYLQLAVPIN